MIAKALFAFALSLLLVLSQAHYTYQLYIAGDNQVRVYVNGRQVVKLDSWIAHVSYPINVSPGDLIQIYVKDLGSKYGVLAVLARYSASRTPVIYQTYPGGTDWIASPYRSSMLPPTQSIITDPYRYSKAKNSNIVIGQPGSSYTFPYCAFPEARYVWAEDAGVRDSILLEHVVLP